MFSRIFLVRLAILVVILAGSYYGVILGVFISKEVLLAILKAGDLFQ